MTTTTAVRIGCVSYLNAKPLIHGLAESVDAAVTLDVPSALLGGLVDGRFDVALLPVIDLQRLPGSTLISAGGIGCDGPTLTVRIFSHVPFGRIDTLACDTHSHSSVALARVILAETFGRAPELIELDHEDPSPAAGAADAWLLIGDKVVCDEPTRFEHQIDLGQAWKELTGLPFLFAGWVARDAETVGDLPGILAAAKVDGLKHVDEIVETFATPRGWPAGLARRYLTEYLKYDVGDRQIRAVRLFHRLAAEHGMIDRPVREFAVI